jgi:hypothetical protein
MDRYIRELRIFTQSFLVAKVRVGPTGPNTKIVFGRGKQHE